MENSKAEIAPESKLSRGEELKQLKAQKKAIADQERALRTELDADKDARKSARRQVTRSKNEVMEKRQAMSGAMRKINNVMLTKSIKNNVADFETALEEWQAAATDFINAGNEHVEAIEALGKYE